MNRRLPRQTSYGGWIAAIVVVLAAVVAGVYLAQRAMHPTPSSPVLPPPPSAVQPASAASLIERPLAQTSASPAPASTASLDTQVDSDASVRKALQSLIHGGHLDALLKHQVISRVVATVDALPRQNLGSASILPLRPPRGVMRTDEVNGVRVIAAGNAERYAPYMAVLAEADVPALVAWYKHNYRLFQQAYRELGYPRGSFNDRLILAIEDMLAAPHGEGSVTLVRSGPYYQFANPQLQSLSWGQKLMLRMGPRNEAQFKTKLRMIRELLAQ